MQDIATVEYLPLETKEDFLLGQPMGIHYMDDEVILISSNNTIFFFDRKTGKGIRSFNRQGRGPGEYLYIGSIAVDAKAGEIFVTQGYSDLDKLFVYDMQGKHLRTMNFDRRMGWGGFLHVYDDGKLFWYDPDIKNPRPYNLLSRTDTVSTSLPIELPNRDEMRIVVNTQNSRTYYGELSTRVLKTAEGYIFSEPGTDTIYHWNKRREELTPIMALTPSFASMEYPVAAYVEGQIGDYLIMRTVERKYDPETGQGWDSNFLIYDKKEGQFYEGMLGDRDLLYNGFSLSVSLSLPVGTIIHSHQAFRLVEGYEYEGDEEIVRGPLAEVAAKLKYDDNPVLMIATFK